MHKCDGCGFNAVSFTKDKDNEIPIGWAKSTYEYGGDKQGIYFVGKFCPTCCPKVRTHVCDVKALEDEIQLCPAVGYHTST